MSDDAMDEEEGFSLALDLDGLNHDFIMGVEMGRLWEQLKQPEPFDQSAHAENLEVVMRMRERVARQITVEDATDEWVHLIVGELAASTEGERHG